MESLRLAVLGVGSMRSGPATMAALAGFFGERPLDIRLHDADPERLDLVDRLARTFFGVEMAEHGLRFSEEPEEMLDGADAVIFALGRNHARRRGLDPEAASAELAALVPPGARVLRVQEASVPLDAVADGGPFAPLDRETRSAMPHQILRWLSGEEIPYEILAAGVESPVRRWLENPGSLPLQR